MVYEDEVFCILEARIYEELTTTDKGVPNGEFGLYQLTFLTNTPTSAPDQITLDNVVFDDDRNGLPSIGSIDAEGQAFSTLTNVYPSVFNRLSHRATRQSQSPLLTRAEAVCCSLLATTLTTLRLQQAINHSPTRAAPMLFRSPSAICSSALPVRRIFRQHRLLQGIL
jgi:hypothetical protein